LNHTKEQQKGSHYAQTKLGLLYESSDTNIEKDLDKAFYWHNKAAENGSTVALYDLGRCYEMELVLKKM